MHAASCLPQTLEVPESLERDLVRNAVPKGLLPPPSVKLGPSLLETGKSCRQASGTVGKCLAQAAKCFVTCVLARGCSAVRVNWWSSSKRRHKHAGDKGQEGTEGQTSALGAGSRAIRWVLPGLCLLCGDNSQI